MPHSAARCSASREPGAKKCTCQSYSSWSVRCGVVRASAMIALIRRTVASVSAGARKTSWNRSRRRRAATRSFASRSQTSLTSLRSTNACSATRSGRCSSPVAAGPVLTRSTTVWSACSVSWLKSTGDSRPPWTLPMSLPYRCRDAYGAPADGSAGVVGVCQNRVEGVGVPVPYGHHDRRALQAVLRRDRAVERVIAPRRVEPAHGGPVPLVHHVVPAGRRDVQREPVAEPEREAELLRGAWAVQHGDETDPRGRRLRHHVRLGVDAHEDAQARPDHGGRAILGRPRDADVDALPVSCRRPHALARQLTPADVRILQFGWFCLSAVRLVSC